MRSNFGHGVSGVADGSKSHRWLGDFPQRFYELSRRYTIRVFGVLKRLAHEASHLSLVIPFCVGGNQGEGAVA